MVIATVNKPFNKNDLSWLDKYDLKKLPVDNWERPDADYGVYEYSGVPRTGKTTLMVADLKFKLLSPDHAYGYKPEDVFCNYLTFIDGVHSITNEGMVEVLVRARRERWKHKVFSIDEASQPDLKLYARGFKDIVQTEIVTSFWQKEKNGCVLQLVTNVEKIIDVQARNCVRQCIVPVEYVPGPSREDDYINFHVIDGRTHEVSPCYQFNYPAYTQTLFDSYKDVI